jgi:alkylation response protein AidB-like acyl-CoA dehydrogenase
MVEEAAGCAALLVTGEVDGKLAQFIVPTTSDGLTIQRLEALDLTRAYFDVRFEGVRVEDADVIGIPGECDASVERQFQIACVLSLAETVGAMDHNFAETLAYAGERIAFGRPIGSFQAIKHLLADTSLVLETSKAVVAAAARSVGESAAEAGEIASLAKAYVADHCVAFTQNCFQVFGGIGYTWEHDHHLYMRRITSDSALYGGAAWHRERICTLAGL